jgi:hypothetical protein
MYKKLAVSLAVLLASTALAAANVITIGLEEVSVGAFITPVATGGSSVSFSGTYGNFLVHTVVQQTNPADVNTGSELHATISIQDTGVPAQISLFISAQDFTTPLGFVPFTSSLLQNAVTGLGVKNSTEVDINNGIFFGGFALSELVPIVPSTVDQTFAQTVMTPKEVALGRPYSLTEFYLFTGAATGDSTRPPWTLLCR